MEINENRWKGKASCDVARSNPMSKIIRELQCSLADSKAEAFISGGDVLLQAGLEQASLLKRACFGCHITTAEEEQRLFQLDFEEAFYLSYEMKCLSVAREDKNLMNQKEMWELMKSRRKNFPRFYIAYSHLRRKNWVVRSGSMYGTDFVVYCHHPALVHSHYAAIVLAEGDSEETARLRLWPNWEGMVRLAGSVAKTLLVLYITGPHDSSTFPSCLEACEITERTITRWNPNRSREDNVTAQNKGH